MSPFSQRIAASRARTLTWWHDDSDPARALRMPGELRREEWLFSWLLRDELPAGRPFRMTDSRGLAGQNRVRLLERLLSQS